MSEWFTGNGKRLDSLQLDDRTWQFGDGVFETIALRNGVPRLLDWHLERCQSGAERLGIDTSSEGLRQSVVAALAAASTGTDFGTLKLVVSAGVSPRGYRRRDYASTHHYVGVFPAAPLPAGHYQAGVRVRLCETRLARQPQLAGMKTLNRLEQVLARNEWTDPGIFEGLTFDTGGLLICGTMSNVFIVDNNTLVTPELTEAGVAGIMRRKVIEIARSSDIDVLIEGIDKTRLDHAREVFLSNSQFGIVPVQKLEGRVLEKGRLTTQLMQQLRDNGIEEIEC